MVVGTVPSLPSVCQDKCDVAEGKKLLYYEFRKQIERCSRNEFVGLFCRCNPGMVLQAPPIAVLQDR